MKQKYFLVCLLVCFAPLTILAQTFTQGDLIYTVTSGTDVSVKAKDIYITTANIPSNVTNAGTIYTVTKIEQNAFFDCLALNSVTIPNSVTSILDFAFAGCSALTSVTIPNSVTSIESNTFSLCTSLVSITIPSSVTSIGKHAFANCSSLTSIIIPNSVISIGQSAFVNCYKLSSVNIPNTVKSIENLTFNRCTALTSITIPDSVISIGSLAFGACSKLASISIPRLVTSIGASAFYDCSALKTVTVLNPIPVIINAGIFGNVTISNIPLIVPAGSESAYRASAVWKDFKSVATLSVSDFEPDNKISIFPNPSTGVFNIETDQNARLEVYDILGKQLKFQKADAELSQVDLSAFNSGIYLLKIVNSSNQTKTAKLIKQ
ncbi:leucine-rich repeat domain-containing protein [Flavobacterium chungangense]|uniref:Secretion system C-terminal sorting domain-containing protein n=1 Tax=Flavobacterium chungangense TaxID=554283 RepID=A0A6V6ZE36_9FLAO|nr:leucine-rich repeat domain-containing protein [Flavobacterium chungangense]CAD0009816.1 hypothetical protein FLACHUCJ7_04456 [Flavobacterium chungangense]